MDQLFKTSLDIGEVGVEKIGVGDVTYHQMTSVIDSRGDLTVGEMPDDVPFMPQRYFVVNRVGGSSTRGEHAHRECHQFLLCVAGSCVVSVDDGLKRAEVLLDAPSKGLHMPPFIWGEQHGHTADAVLLVFCSHHYNPDEYIRDYDEFLAAIEQRNHL